MTKEKILVISHEFPPFGRGAERMTINLFRGLNRKLFNPTLILAENVVK